MEPILISIGVGKPLLQVKNSILEKLQQKKQLKAVSVFCKARHVKK